MSLNPDKISQNCLKLNAPFSSSTHDIQLSVIPWYNECILKNGREIIYMQGKIVSVDEFKAVGMTYLETITIVIS